METLTDDSIMPFGMHKGKMVCEVPDSYMFWYWTQTDGEHRTETCPIAAYIKRNLSAFERDYPDGIWR